MNAVEIICSILGAVGTVLAGVWFIVNKAQKMAVNDYRLGNMETDVSSLKSDVSSLKSGVSKLNDNMAEIKEDMAAVKTVLMQKFPNVISRMAMKKSPRKLNETGEWVFNQVGGKKFLADNKDFFFRKIDSMKPKTAFDVEQAANFACAGYTDNEIFNDIKLYVYNAPAIKVKDSDGKERDYEITLGDVCYALSLPLRDMYLEEHQEIPR